MSNFSSGSSSFSDKTSWINTPFREIRKQLSPCNLKTGESTDEVIYLWSVCSDKLSAEDFLVGVTFLFHVFITTLALLHRHGCYIWKQNINTEKDLDNLSPKVNNRHGHRPDYYMINLLAILPAKQWFSHYEYFVLSFFKQHLLVAPNYVLSGKLS